MAKILSSQDTRLYAGARVVLPAIWLGLIIGISLIEAPLKFTAPGITIPLGLGIGRLVFTAMNWVEIVIAVILLWAVLKEHVGRLYRGLACGMIAVLIIKITVIRPLLNKRTDAVLAGVNDGGSSLHLLYIAADGILILGLITMLIVAVRRWVTVQPASQDATPN
ncbi:MAG: hypothetical protein L0I80_09245 [Brevibacterium sp.]|uniref:hypothetical protein n=1 Tax=Brevibacterium sp. TaxID=1701 RepID=UPI002648FBF1|nr:hypothetical protein [Brevibacterium sp.]MDN5808113.1 hypothetical protein [Brevibacterium sp.]MDN5877764.1 hypothetical protein [Brevibacterium sp.]MDN5910811.1 hypothetical protein [Brevibacterium sp.]MDN6124034.1 hypothetical protein [Brevibacterium sp.]MDN6135040.1 hypothetical protein [Brevibacterium sp.]